MEAITREEKIMSGENLTSITRKEMFLAKLVGKEIETPFPITRMEKIMNGDQLTPITREEMFLAKAAGQNVKTPTPITREEMFLSMISCGKTDQQQYTAGLYETGSIALYEAEGAKAIEGKMIKSWDELVAEGTVHIEDGAVYTNMDVNTMTNASADALTGDVFIPCDGSITSIGNAVQTSETTPPTGNIAFMFCENLTGVYIPNSITIITMNAFAGCTGLTSITIPNSVTVIEISTFQRCTNLTSVTIPDSITAIGASAFNGCNSLISITIPDSVTSIGGSAFYNCTSLQNIEIPDGVTSIGEGVFQKCSSLTSIDIPDGVTSISNYAFYDCTGLSSIVFEGTIAQWNAISKDTNWNKNVPATEVVCSDGEVSLV